MIALELTAAQGRAVDLSYDECCAIVGPAASGKSTALRERVERARRLHPDAQPLVAGGDGLAAFAFSLLTTQSSAMTPIDDAAAELLFAHMCAPLFALGWDELSCGQIDPEVPGLRSPERFAAAAFRLIRRLRESAIAPAAFLESALAGANEFYAHPPNLGEPALLTATKAAFHDSLEATPPELDRQRRREIDLAKILARLYAEYVALVESTERMTGRDAVIAAAGRLRADEALALDVRNRVRLAFVDDAQELTRAELQLLTEIFGEALAGVTLCGDAASAISSVRMSQREAAFVHATARVELPELRPPAPVEAVRVASAPEEATLVAERVAAWIEAGVSPRQIAVLFRSVRSVSVYEAALLDRGIPVVVSGDNNLFEDRRVLDALALLWNVHDPFRHEWLLRTLGNPVVGLSDASLAALCAEPLDPQRRLFAFDDEPPPTARARRWDPKRDLRLGWNVIRGEQDGALSPDAARRVRHFRALRERWLDAANEEPFDAFVRTVWREGLARDGPPGSPRALSQQFLLRRLLARLNEFFARETGAGLGDALEYAERRMESDLEASEPPTDDAEFVRLLSVEAARGRHFERVVVANVRPGAFPLWYAPDSFLFSPRLGMIPKDNAGDARASRTAKFTYYVFRSKASQQYNRRERRAFRYALRRARDTALVTAWGTPTRGTTAPEFLEELR